MKNIANKFLDSRNAVFGLFLILSISLMYNTLKVIQKNYALQSQVDLLIDEVALVEVQNQNLRYNIEYYKTDSYLEVEAKRRFSLAGSGEKVVLLAKDGDGQQEELRTTIEQRQEAKPLHQDNFEKWMIFLFGNSN